MPDSRRSHPATDGSKLSDDTENRRSFGPGGILARRTREHKTDAYVGDNGEQQFRKNYHPILTSSQKPLQNPT